MWRRKNYSNNHLLVEYLLIFNICIWLGWWFMMIKGENFERNGEVWDAQEVYEDLFLYLISIF